MKRILISQVTFMAAAALFCALLMGAQGFWSALAGGAVYFFPSCVAALFLKFFRPAPGLQGRVFIVGEILKVALSLSLMLAVFWMWRDSLAFLPFLLGLFGVSQLVFLLSLRVRSYGR